MGAVAASYEVRWRLRGSNGAWNTRIFPARGDSVELTGLERGQTYDIEARALSEAGTPSDWVPVTVLIDDATLAPRAPTNLTAQSVADGVALSWQVDAEQAADVEYIIERATAETGPFSELTRVRALQYTDPVTDGDLRWYRVRAVNFGALYSAYSNAVSSQAVPLGQALADIAAAAADADAALALADGELNVIFSATAPSGNAYGMLDLWLDTDNDYKPYRWRNGAWEDASNWTLAIAYRQALLSMDAATLAQTTADGKAKVFRQESTPTATGVGDLWIKPSNGTVYSWTGSAWSTTADVTRDQLAGNGINLLPDEISIPESGLPAIGYSTGGSITRDAFSYFGLGSYRLVSTNSDQYHVFDQVFKLEGGKKYLLSMYVYSSVASAVLQSFFFGAAGSRFVNLSPAGDANTWSRVTAVVDLTHISGVQTFQYRIDNHEAAGVTTYVDGIMLEEMIGSKTTPSAYSRGQLSNRIAQAIAAAAAAQETADGKIETFYQPSMPSGASLGDLWFDTDDGNKLYRHDGTAFVPAQDAAIGHAINLAAGAQATADGKVTTFYSSTAPTGASLGDLWFSPSEGNKLYRYNGTTWVAVQDAGIAQAIAAAAAAQDTADGKIETFYQSTPPAIGTGSGQARLGDLWFDTDDGNKLYRCNGSSWVAAQDAAIAQAISAAAGAQATADGKVTTYYSSTQPTATAVGDLWYDTSRKTLYRWSGSQWILVGDNSLETQQTAMLVKDGGFEAGGQGWMLAPNARIDRGAGVPYIGSAALTHDPVAGGPVRQSGCEMFAVAPGERIVAEAMLRNWQGGADGYAALVIWFYDENGGFITAGSSQSYANGRAAGNNWRKCTALALVPANARLCRIGMETTNSAGFWVGDQFRASKQPQVEPQPSNLIPNANFGGINGDKAPWVIGWNPANANIDRFHSKKEGMIGPDWTVEGATGQLEIRQMGRGGGSPGFVNFDCGTTNASLISVLPGQRYELHCKVASHDCDVTIGVIWYDANKTAITSEGPPYARAIGGKSESLFKQIGGFYTAPSNAAFARVLLRKSDTDAGAGGSYAWFIKPYFGPAKEDQQEFSPWVPSQPWTADEVPTGNFGVVNTTDLWDAGGTRRVGLRVHGSGHRLGSQSNAPQSLTTAYGSVRNTTALTASSSGAVSVNAHVVRYGGFSVSYNAVANAVTGLAQNTRYVIYCFDPDYTGGTKTWYAGPNPDAVMQLGDGVVIAGEVTIPNSGTGSGGGGGGGGGDNWCVDATMRLPDGRLAGDITAGDVIACWDENAAAPGVQERDVESNMLVESQPCTRIMTVSGAAVVASDCTPMTLRDGRIVRITEMFGEDALVRHADGTLAWEPVVSCTSVGSRTVAKIKVHQLSYFAGESTAATIATHNPIYKP